MTQTQLITQSISEELIKRLSPRQALSALWQEGLAGRQLLKEHSSLIDKFINDLFLALPETDRDGLALVALGGYGRQELFPYSDIDLLLLYHPEVAEEIESLAEKLFYPLWDTGLDVGHGVRTLDACLEDARKDFFFQVALLDARLICGNKGLFSSLLDRSMKRFVHGQRKAFTENMMAHRNQRHIRFGDHTYLLEPNIKESRGGLRDYQAILWTAKVMFGLEGLEALSDAGMLTTTEAKLLEESHECLIRIRNKLHYVSGRKNDRLYFEYQQDIAKALGHHNLGGILAVEHFMGHVHKCMHDIATTSDLFFEHVQEVLGLKRPASDDCILEPGIELIGGKIHLTDRELIKRKPDILMKVFLHAARQGCPVHYLSRRIISETAPDVTRSLRKSKRASNAFLDILVKAKNPGQVLDEMLETGLLTAYLPEFKRILALAQHDVYHVYTVDRHSTETVVELHHLREKEPARFKALESPQLLFLAALLHDIGKGEGSGHAERGGEIALKIGKRMGLTDKDASCLSFLVKNHLFLIDTAMRRDLEDEALIIKCARKIKQHDILNMLFLLTIADSKATGPTVWNDWKAALLLELYQKVAHLLDQSYLVDPDRIQAVEWMKEQVASRLGLEESKKVLPYLPEDYLLSFTPEAIIHHQQLKGQLAVKNALVLPESKGNYWSLLIMARDRTGLMARICGTLALHNLNVLTANIFTLKDGIAVDVLDVYSTVDLKFHEKDWAKLQSDLEAAIDYRLGLSHRLAEKFSGVPFKANKTGIHHETKVVVDNRASDFYTLIEVCAEDTPCLLYSITRTLADFGINISKARIGKNVDQALDVFYVLDNLGQKIEDRGFAQEIKKALQFAATGCLI